MSSIYLSFYSTFPYLPVLFFPLSLPRIPIFSFTLYNNSFSYPLSIPFRVCFLFPSLEYLLLFHFTVTPLSSPLVLPFSFNLLFIHVTSSRSTCCPYLVLPSLSLPGHSSATLVLTSQRLNRSFASRHPIPS